ncbi:cytochrome c4 [Bradyrhizobium jicamae]|uniref:Cytochrome c4 n=1 Tax=Bradyrhizobium jicamae TaxID=280332 RepID=A0ABS5FHW2_9BRAD|nr:c-type cytochrome [Bradyrhizobium jicamae]MBR0796371.1 cytochrome c4 [Bradyrhizobium jicamae]MBR0932411.1 cytochrome c4 [Bradyrhizobium jicamae]
MFEKLAICVVVLLLAATQARAETIEDKVQVCAGCHGADGKPVDKTIPTIWGQQAGYLYIQLRDFKRGDRKSDIMQPVASQFERDDMLAIAEYFAQKPWPDLGQPRAPKDVAGKALGASASVGCPACHLDHFQGDGTVPRLAGMGRDYLAKTIADFRTRARGNNPGMSDLMLATPLDDLAALVDYLAGL